MEVGSPGPGSRACANGQSPSGRREPSLGAERVGRAQAPAFVARLGREPLSVAAGQVLRTPSHACSGHCHRAQPPRFHRVTGACGLRGAAGRLLWPARPRVWERAVLLVQELGTEAPREAGLGTAGHTQAWGRPARWSPKGPQRRVATPPPPRPAFSKVATASRACVRAQGAPIGKFTGRKTVREKSVFTTFPPKKVHAIMNES